MNYGFITCLPRSGSAWLSNYLSYGNTMILHDAWKNATPTQLKDKFDQAGVYAAGTADPVNMMWLDEIDKVFPTAKWVLITRPMKEVKESCKTIDFPLADFTDNLKRLTETRDVLKIQFKDIFDKADTIGRYIYPDWECPKWRKDSLKDLNVQIHWGRVSEQFKVPKVLPDTQVVTPAKMAFHRLLKEITAEDPHALRFLAQARDASELYRGINESTPIDTKRAKETLEAMATEWLVSPFVTRFSSALAPSIASALEKYQNNDIKHCPIDIDLVSVVTYIFRGNDGVKQYMPKVRELSEQILREKT